MPAVESAAPFKAGFRTSGGRIYDGDKVVKLHGLNWFGFESDITGLHGLWTGRKLESFVDQAVGLGFNALRIPITGRAFDASVGGRDGYASPLAQLHALLSYTKAKGVYVLLDLHNCPGNYAFNDKPAPGQGRCGYYSEDAWIKDLKKLAQLSNTYKNVVGIDLWNEPYGPTWQQWAEMATRAGNAVLSVNPNVLVFVEGVGNASDAAGYSVFWGENLVEAARVVPKIPLDRLVYSPHVYGPSVANQSYFDAPGFPGNMPAIWDAHFGYLKSKQYTLAVGEFGGRMEGKDLQLNRKLIQYFADKGIENWFMWSLNPNSGDTGGLLKDDWQTVQGYKYDLLRQLLTK